MQPARRRSFYRRRKTIRIYIRASERMHRALALAAQREERISFSLALETRFFRRRRCFADSPPLRSLLHARRAAMSREERAALERAYGMAYIEAKAAPVQQLPRFCPPASADALRRGPPPPLHQGRPFSPFDLRCCVRERRMCATWRV